MRSAEEIRQRAMTTLHYMLLRPSMYGRDQGYETAVGTLLQDLAFIDEREDELRSSLEELRERGWWSAMGAWGAVADATGRDADLEDEVASVYARVAACLGYFSPPHHLPEHRWNEIAESAVTWARSARRFADDVRANFGPPSYCSHARQPAVLAYAAEGDHQWISFDVADGEGALRSIRVDRRDPPSWGIDLREARGVARSRVRQGRAPRQDRA